MINAYRGKYRNEENLRRERWEMVRWSTSVLLSPNLKKGIKLKPIDLVRFPWEKPKVNKAKQAEMLRRL